MHNRAATVAAVIFLSACVTNNPTGPDSSTAISQKTTDIIATCGGGISSGVKASAEANIGKSLKEGGKLTVEAKQEIRAAFFGDADASNANVQKSYDTFVGCVDKRL